jgi:hypothetical protein
LHSFPVSKYLDLSTINLFWLSWNFKFSECIFSFIPYSCKLINLIVNLSYLCHLEQNYFLITHSIPFIQPYHSCSLCERIRCNIDIVLNFVKPKLRLSSYKGPQSALQSKLSKLLDANLMPTCVKNLRLREVFSKIEKENAWKFRYIIHCCVVVFLHIHPLTSVQVSSL